LRDTSLLRRIDVIWLVVGIPQALDDFCLFAQWSSHPLNALDDLSNFDLKALVLNSLRIALP